MKAAILTLLFGVAIAAGLEAQQVNWMSWQEAMERSLKEERKIILDVYTEWCSWCERMEKNTFQEPAIAEYLNKNFYPVKLNAESRKELEYKDQAYNYVQKGQRGYHELAAELLRGRLSYPTVVVFNEKQEVIQAIVGFKSPEQFERIAIYFAEDYYKKVPWSTYQKNFKRLVAD